VLTCKEIKKTAEQNSSFVWHYWSKSWTYLRSKADNSSLQIYQYNRQPALCLLSMFLLYKVDDFSRCRQHLHWPMKLADEMMEHRAAMCKQNSNLLDSIRRPYNLYCVGGDVKPCSFSFCLSTCLQLSWRMPLSTSSLYCTTNSQKCGRRNQERTEFDKWALTTTDIPSNSNTAAIALHTVNTYTDSWSW